MPNEIMVVFGGSFNPPLNSHFSLAQQILSEYEEIKKIMFVPVNSKYQKVDLIENEHRYQMLKRICDKNSDFLLSSFEIDSERSMYTIETLQHMEEEFPQYQIWFTIGTDNLKQLSSWEKAQELVDKYKVLVLERDNEKMEDIIRMDPFLQRNHPSFQVVKQNVRSNISSTFVRDKIRRGKSIRYLTPDEVLEYIEKNQLFQ